jgi:membrane-associated phospholipid phosphatase
VITDVLEIAPFPQPRNSLGKLLRARMYLWLSLVLVTSTGLPCDSLAQINPGSSAAPYGQTSVYWNEVARDLVGIEKLDPVSASRVYAFLSIAQNDAVATAQGAEGQRSGGSPAVLDMVARYAAASASVAVLSEFFPLYRNQMRNAYAGWAEAVELEEATAGTITHQNASGHAVAVAKRVLLRARDDGSDHDGEIAVPDGPGYWRTEPARRPLRPYWGQVRPLLMDSVDHFVAEPPPPVESPGFRSALTAVKVLASQLSGHQWKLVRHWADGVGTSTPAGHWNEIAAALILDHGLSERSAARTFALLNIALFDAGIACWKTKYTYWLARPNQLDAAIMPSIAVPNFPSYTSGHASFSGAAAEVLSYLFPDEAKRIRESAEEAAVSRVYAGIHFPFDSAKGLEIGHRIGRLAAELNEHPGELLPHLK